MSREKDQRIQKLEAALKQIASYDGKCLKGQTVERPDTQDAWLERQFRLSQALREGIEKGEREKKDGN